MKAFCRLSPWALSTAVLLLAAQASALTVYGSYVGPNVSYTNMQEASSSGDPEPLWGAPTGSGNQLLFFPSAFVASAIGAAGFDHTGSQFQTLITGTSPTDTLTQFNITEYGDAQIFGAGGTAGTSTYAAMTGFLTVMEDIDGALDALVIIPFTGVFTPSDNLNFVNDFGVTIWSATVSIDISAYVPNATKVQLSLDNDLYAFSEAGTSAQIQKKVVDGPAVVIEVVPEPGTALLVGGGLMIMSLRGRRRGRA